MSVRSCPPEFRCPVGETTPTSSVAPPSRPVSVRVRPQRPACPLPSTSVRVLVLPPLSFSTTVSPFFFLLPHPVWGPTPWLSTHKEESDPWGLGAPGPSPVLLSTGDRGQEWESHRVSPGPTGLARVRGVLRGDKSLRVTPVPRPPPGPDGPFLGSGVGDGVGETWGRQTRGQEAPVLSVPTSDLVPEEERRGLVR